MNKIVAFIKSLDEQLKDTPLGRWNERHKTLIMVTFVIVLVIAILQTIVVFRIHQNLHH